MKYLIIPLMFLVTSCSLAPFGSNKSARSYGAANTQFELGNANSNYYLKLGFGATQDLDIGYIMEFGNISTSGIFFKYSYNNNQKGGSEAFEAGYGGTESSTYYYLGWLGSYAFNESLELFINPRYTNVSTDEKDIELGDTVGNITVTEEQLSYLYLSSGINIWLSQTFGLSIYTIYVNGHGLRAEDNFTSAATAMFRF